MVLPSFPPPHFDACQWNVSLLDVLESLPMQLGVQMSRGVQRCRTDSNHTEIMEALRNIGAKPQSLAIVGDGCPDLIVGYQGVNVLLEIKDGAKVPSKQALTAAERDWHETWPGQVSIVRNAEEAQMAVINFAKRQVTE